MRVQVFEPPLTPLSAKCPQPVNLTGMLFLELGPCEGDVVSSNPISTQGVGLNPYLLSTRTRYPVDRVAVLRMTFEVGFLPAVGVDSTARRSACKLVAFVSHGYHITLCAPTKYRTPSLRIRSPLLFLTGGNLRSVPRPAVRWYRTLPSTGFGVPVRSCPRSSGE